MRPVLIAVDGGAEALLDEGLTPGHDRRGHGLGRGGCSDERSGRRGGWGGGGWGSSSGSGGAELVVHAYPDGRAPGRERLEQLGLPFKLVPAPGTSQDVAMLIAAEKGANLIVSVGSQFNLVEFLDRNREGMSSTFLTRLRIGEILVDAKGVSRLYHPRPGLAPLLVVVIAGLLAMIAVVWLTPALRDVVDLLWLKLQLLAEGLAIRPSSAPAADAAVTRRSPPNMFDYRYHALSLAAVLLALAVGVLIGVAIGDSNLVSSAKNGIVHNLESEVERGTATGRISCRPS